MACDCFSVVYAAKSCTCSASAAYMHNSILSSYRRAIKAFVRCSVSPASVTTTPVGLLHILTSWVRKASL